jgi:hypothetical protein
MQQPEATPSDFQQQLMVMMKSMNNQLAENFKVTSSLQTKITALEDFQANALLAAESASTKDVASSGGGAGVSINHGAQREATKIIGIGLQVDPNDKADLVKKLKTFCKRTVKEAHQKDKLDANYETTFQNQPRSLLSHHTVLNILNNTCPFLDNMFMGSAGQIRTLETALTDVVFCEVWKKVKASIRSWACAYQNSGSKVKMYFGTSAARQTSLTVPHVGHNLTSKQLTDNAYVCSTLLSFFPSFFYFYHRF